MVYFSSRKEAGVVLSQKFLPLKDKLRDPIVFGIPRGGVSIGFQVAKALDCSLDTIVLRKLPLPEDPEAGFGAVTLDRTTILNERILSQVNLSSHFIERIIDNVYKEVLRRNRVYRKDKTFPDLNERSVILTDDGLATGYTMLAAIKFVKEKGTQEIIVGVPVAHREAYNLVKQQVDKVIALHISDLPFFAVASFYREFPDMSDQEVVSYLK